MKNSRIASLFFAADYADLREFKNKPVKISEIRGKGLMISGMAATWIKLKILYRAFTHFYREERYHLKKKGKRPEGFLHNELVFRKTFATVHKCPGLLRRYEERQGR